MKRKHYLLDLFNGVDDRFVMAAIKSRESSKPVVRKNRVMLIAAAIAVALVLVGCAAVYFWLQDMSIGTKTHTQRYDDQGKVLEQPVTIQQQIFNFAGFSDSPIQKAASEWNAFRRSYDPERKIRDNLPDVSDLPDIPNVYEYVYNCYTPEMVEKLNEIVKKYNIKLSDEWVPIQRWQSDIALEALGLTSLLKDDTLGKMGPVSGTLYPPYGFDLEFDFALTGVDAVWTKTIQARVNFNHKDYLPVGGVWALDLNSIQQWHYITADGVDLLMVLTPYGDGFMVAEKSEGFLVVAISGNTSGSKYPSPNQVPDKEVLEQMAEVFDFTFNHQAIDAAAMEPKLEAANSNYQSEHAYVPILYNNFEEYLKANVIWGKPTEESYVFYDLTGDGEKDLLLGYGGYVECCLSLEDGHIKERFISGYLCEGGVVESTFKSQHSIEERFSYFKPQYNTDGDNDYQFLGRGDYADGQWHLTTDPNTSQWDAPIVSQTEVDTFRAKYPRLDLNWISITEYPLSDGGTLGDFLRTLNRKPSSEELRDIYANCRTVTEEDSFYTHYRILDINGDGVDDLLLSGDGEKFWTVMTYGYGQVQHLMGANFYLCENGIMERTSIVRKYRGIEIEEHVFFTMQGLNTEESGYAAYNKSTASWQSDLDGTPMAEADAQSILAQYPRIDQGMRPIGELIK